MSSAVADFYGGTGDLMARVRTTLERAGLDLERMTPGDLAPIDEFHIRGRAATLELLDALDLTPRSRLLDLGSGLGGPARTAAEVVGCHVTGVDITPAFCAMATALSEWTGLADRTTFAVADATALRYADHSFDAAMTIHVGMNIADKAGMYAEAARVLRPGSRFAIYDVLQGAGGPVRYPVPWAEDPSTSFLATPAAMRELLSGAGFELIREVDSSDRSLTWFEELRARVERDGPPQVTFQAFLGERFPQMAANQVANLREDRIRTVTFVARTPD